MKKYHIGYVLPGGGIIVDGPQHGQYETTGKKYIKWKVECPICKTSNWKFSSTFGGLKHPCKKCYDNSMKRFDDVPAVRRAFASLKANAKTRGVTVSITIEEFEKEARKSCTYCGADPIEKRGPKRWQKGVMLNGIDRIDSERGYDIDNITSCCYQCNWSKRDLSLEEWKNWLMSIVNNGVLA